MTAKYGHISPRAGKRLAAPTAAAPRGSFRAQRSRIKSGTAMDCLLTPWSIPAPMAGWTPALREGASC